MIFSPHKDFIIAVYLFEPDPELHSGTERSSFSDNVRRPGPEPSVLSVNLAGSGPVMFFIDSPFHNVFYFKYELGYVEHAHVLWF